MDQWTRSLSKIAPQSRICAKSWTVLLSGAVLNWLVEPTAGQDMCRQQGQIDWQIIHVPDQVTTYGHTSYPRAIRETMSSDILHRTNKYLNNRLEQDHRGIKQRYYSMRGLGIFESAARFCCAFDELRSYFRSRHTMDEPVSLPEQ